MINLWSQPLISRLSCTAFSQLNHYFCLQQFSHWPNAAGLNQLKLQTLGKADLCPAFICQHELPDTGEYYEQIIYQHLHIPTRPDNWHDLFNGLVWLQFPRSKKLLNELHMADIAEFGLNPRTKRRNHLTHFDECGVVIAIEHDSEHPPIAELLQQHAWSTAFVDHRQCWGQSVHHFMFGHANLEMLLKPFIGLTGKWLAINVAPGFSALRQAEQLKLVDEQLYRLIASDIFLNSAKPLYPMPLLGLPGIDKANELASFYANSDYFRPKPVAKKKATGPIN